MRERLNKPVRDAKLPHDQAYTAMQHHSLFSGSSSEERRKVRAAVEACDAAYATHRSAPATASILTNAHPPR